MSDAADASSVHQDSLPMSSDALLAQLTEWGIDYALYEHVPLKTVEEAKSVEAAFVETGRKTLRLKNLYLRDRKKRNYLVSLEQDRPVDLKALGAAIGANNLSFGSAGRLLEFLGVRPGAVTPLAMITGQEAGVTFYMDAAAQEAEVIYMHPLVNDRTVALSRAAFEGFMQRIGVALQYY